MVFVGKRGRRRARDRGPDLHVKVLYAATDLRDIAPLLKPAVLYGDRVTVYSPAAFLVDAAAQFSELKTPLEQFDAIRELSEHVPTALPQIDMDEATLASFRQFLAVPRHVAMRRVRGTGSEDEIAELQARIDQLQTMWETEMPGVFRQIVDMTGADVLMTAIRSGTVEVAPLSTGESDPIADSLRAAAREAPGPGIDPILSDFVNRVVDTVTDPGAYPLLDADSKGLVRSMETAMPAMGQRASEISAVAEFMSFLPSFPDLPMDEILDLRAEISAPLIRFRSAMVNLSRQFESRPLDDAFAREIEDAWREHVAPALAEIREALAEHGLLRSVASVATGDPRRILSEVGGAVALASTDLVSMSGLLTAGLATGVPLADTALRAVKAHLEAQRTARRHSFYFLHKVDDEARRRLSS